MDWIQYIASDEDEAIKDIYRTYRDECLTWLHRERQISKSEGLDIFQNSVVSLYQNVSSGKLQKLNSNIKTYLFGIVKNKAHEHQRAHQSTLPLHEELNQIGEDDSNESIAYESRLARVLSGLQQIGDPCKTLLRSFYYQKMSIGDIALKMGYSDSNTCKTKKYKCIKRLQSLLIPHKVSE